MLQNDTVARYGFSPFESRMPAGAEPVVVEINVRDLLEARAFYVSIFGDCDSVCTETSLQFRVDSQRIGFAREANVSARGRVSRRYQLGNAGYVPVPHRIAVKIDYWQAIADRLVRSDIAHELYAESGDDGRRLLRIVINDPSGNVLEIHCCRPDLEMHAARWRMKWLVRSAVALALAAFFAFVLWPYEEPPKSQNYASTSF